MPDGLFLLIIDHMQINVPYIAQLANLPLTLEEAKKFEKQLSAVLEHIKKLSEVAIDGIVETSQVTGLANISRTDTITVSLPQKDVLASTTKAYHNMFAVPVIIEEAVET